MKTCMNCKHGEKEAREEPCLSCYHDGRKSKTNKSPKWEAREEE